MTLAIKVRRGGAAGAAETDYTAQVPLYSEDSSPLLDAGMMCGNGSACQWQFTLIDDAGEIPRVDGTKNLPAHTVVTVSDDAPGFVAWLGRGRIAGKSIDRGDHPWGDSRTFRVTVEDANVDLRGLTLTTDWVRAEETDVARVLSMMGNFCAGNPRPSTVIENHFVTPTPTTSMPAKTYPAGTELPEIMADCATAAGKIYSIVIHHVNNASHLCMLYIAEGDLSTFVSDIGITDDAPDLVNWFPPEWDQGAATIEESQELTTGLVSRFGGGDEAGTVFVQDVNDATSYDYWVLPYADTLSVTEAQATTRAHAVRETRSRERLTHSVTIMIPGSQVHRLCAGMAIDIKAAAAMGGQYLHTIQRRRIAQLKWEQVTPEVSGVVPGYYKAHMQLDRPLQLTAAAPGVGNLVGGALAAGVRAIQAVQDLSIGGANLVKNSSFENRGGWYVGPHWSIEHNPLEPERAFHGQHVARLEMTGDQEASGELLSI